MDQRVSEPFGSEEKQGQDGQSDLKTLGVEFRFCHRLLAPLSGGLGAQTADFSNYIKIHYGSQEGQNHHGDADGILMKSVSRCVNSRGRC